jgi:hypothetical protein
MFAHMEAWLLFLLRVGGIKPGAPPQLNITQLRSFELLTQTHLQSICDLVMLLCYPAKLMLDARGTEHILITFFPLGSTSFMWLVVLFVNDMVQDLFASYLVERHSGVRLTKFFAGSAKHMVLYIQLSVAFLPFLMGILSGVMWACKRMGFGVFAP